MVWYLEPEIATTTNVDVATTGMVRQRTTTRTGISSISPPLERVASSMFVFGATPGHPERPQLRSQVSLSEHLDQPHLSSQATLGRNSQFLNLTPQDREKLGGIEYRSLKLLLKIVVGN
jgi:hypothetical protein